MAAIYQLVDANSQDLVLTPQFVATSLAAAQTFAQSWATLFARSVMLAGMSGSGLSLPWTAYTPAAQGGTVSSPSGITF
jgi:hypothetical protein